MLFACHSTENKRSGIVTAAISGWYAETSPAKASDPVPAIIESRNVAAQVGQPTKRPSAAPAMLPKIPRFGLGGFDRERV